MNIPEDKILHFCAGVGIAILAAVVLRLDPVYQFALAAGVGVAKEVVWDWLLKKGTPDVWDAIATAVGGAVVGLAGWQ